VLIQKSQSGFQKTIEVAYFLQNEKKCLNTKLKIWSGQKRVIYNRFFLGFYSYMRVKKGPLYLLVIKVNDITGANVSFRVFQRIVK
jgi:hypothetical protein